MVVVFGNGRGDESGGEGCGVADEAYGGDVPDDSAPGFAFGVGFGFGYGVFGEVVGEGVFAGEPEVELGTGCTRGAPQPKMILAAATS